MLVLVVKDQRAAAPAAPVDTVKSAEKVKLISLTLNKFRTHDSSGTLFAYI